MDLASRTRLVAKLLERIQGEQSDDPLFDLITTLNHAGRDDMLLLIDDLFSRRTDKEIMARLKVDSPDNLAREFLKLHAIFQPIADGHRSSTAEATAARSIHRRMSDSRRRKAIGDVIGDPSWPIDPAARDQLQRVLKTAKESPPVPFEALAETLGLPSTLDVVDLLLPLHARFNAERKRKENRREPQ